MPARSKKRPQATNDVQHEAGTNHDTVKAIAPKADTSMDEKAENVQATRTSGRHRTATVSNAADDVVASTKRRRNQPAKMEDRQASDAAIELVEKPKGRGRKKTADEEDNKAETPAPKSKSASTVRGKKRTLVDTAVAPAGDGGAEDVAADDTKPKDFLNITGYWLMKNEPEELSLDILQEKPDKTWYWDGVRNYQARNFMRQMKVGDKIIFYYSSCKVPGIAGVAEVAKTAYPDFTAWDPKSKYFDAKSDPAKPRWDMVDVKYVRHMGRYLPLEELRKHYAAGKLDGMALFTRFRLSVMPISKEHWDFLLQIEHQDPPQ